MQTQHENTLSLLESHPMTRQLREQQAAEVLAARKAAAQEIAKLERKRDVAMPPLHEAYKLALEAHQIAQAALQEAEKALHAARSEKGLKAAHFARAISRQEDVLMRTYDSEIDSALQFFRDKLDWLRQNDRLVEQQRLAGKRDMITETQKLVLFSNFQAIKEAIIYCQAATRALECMRLQPTFNPDDVSKLKAAIPSIDVFAEHTSTKKDVRHVKPRRIMDDVEKLLSRVI